MPDILLLLESTLVTGDADVQYWLKMPKGKGLTGDSYRTLASKDATTLASKEAAKRIVTIFMELKKYPRLRKVA